MGISSALSETGSASGEAMLDAAAAAAASSSSPFLNHIVSRNLPFCGAGCAAPPLALPFPPAAAAGAAAGAEGAEGGACAPPRPRGPPPPQPAGGGAPPLGFVLRVRRGAERGEAEHGPRRRIRGLRRLAG